MASTNMQSGMAEPLQISPYSAVKKGVEILKSVCWPIYAA